MDSHQEDGRAYSITLKGQAVLAAVEAGLLPECEGGWDNTGFNRFWELFEPILRKKVEKEILYAIEVFDQQRNQRADDRAQKRIKKLESTVNYLISFIVGTYLTLIVPRLIRMFIG